ncbi:MULTISPECIES: potassium channel family protein [unclassified Curtobacterium]|uniref:potassium channel family protein n=1 Tax=unclassified Curtobacterium TaxID=257496 RepID=UPI0010EE3344|nr:MULTISPECIES: potassium channel family protein [unclassified Curtobacterium]TCU51033.1 voltage-gated potassium channel [Curtobacterium sp. PhB146]TCU86705.1 voltage-gated potassium channel [Curtobacterium sp. PhB191]
MAVISLVFIVDYSVVVLSPTTHGPLSAAMEAFLVATVVVFAADVAVRAVLSPRGERLEFLVHHPADVLAIALPLFRALRAIRLFDRIALRDAGDAVRMRVLLSAAAYGALFVYFIALATLQTERNAPGATITSLGTALWWAAVTIATVGYGDTYPVTDLGRLYAVLLMVGGVAIVGTATALMISYLSDRVERLRRAGPATPRTPAPSDDPPS